jgi:isoleucyl-tRNA synthetase
VNYSDEVPFGEKMFIQLAETYRRIRNTVRILLANLYDFDPIKDQSLELTLIDRWMLGRLQELITQCREAYERFEFHKVYHAINQFCAIELSSLYIDITKDRLYCDAPSSQRRRATQTVMRQVLDNLVRLLAPILAFTAEEVWGYFGKSSSVHVELFPDADRGRIDESALHDVEALLRARTVIAHAIENARQQQLIGNRLEARVELALPNDDRVRQLPIQDVEEFLILSHLQLVTTDGPPAARVTKTEYGRCERCWRHLPTVGSAADHPTLCDRCTGVLSQLAESE